MQLTKYKYILSLAVLLSYPLTHSAQEAANKEIRNNSVYIEVSPPIHKENPGLFSVNYERLFGKHDNLILRVGVFPDFEPNDVNISLPLVFGAMTMPQEKSHMEFGIGIVPTIYYDYYNPYKKLWSNGFCIMAPVMYRYQNQNKFIFRAGGNFFLGFGGLVFYPAVSLSLRF